MELSALGFDHWFQKNYANVAQPGFAVAKVTRMDRERYLIRNEGEEVQAEPAGKLLFSAESTEDLPCVGDWVLVQYHNGGTLAIIHDVLPRKTFLRRKSAGAQVEYQMIASNIDVAFIVQSCDLNFNVRRMERYLVMVREGHVEPLILLSKSDLVSGEVLQAMMNEIRDSKIDARMIAFSNQTEAGLQALRQELQSAKTYCLLGSSGVGKTTLINNLLGREEFETQAVREKDGRGRHTTARRQLIKLDNCALFIDTPGMRELGLIGVGNTIEQSFADIYELTGHCRFADCSHTVEIGCAVLGAVQSGELSRERYQSYIKLMKESEFHEMSYIERRQKEKEFGRMINVAKKQLKKRKPSSY